MSTAVLLKIRILGWCNASLSFSLLVDIQFLEATLAGTLTLFTSSFLFEEQEKKLVTLRSFAILPKMAKLRLLRKTKNSFLFEVT